MPILWVLFFIGVIAYSIVYFQYTAIAPPKSVTVINPDGSKTETQWTDISKKIFYGETVKLLKDGKEMPKSTPEGLADIRVVSIGEGVTVEVPDKPFRYPIRYGLQNILQNIFTDFNEHKLKSLRFLGILFLVSCLVLYIILEIAEAFWYIFRSITGHLPADKQDANGDSNTGELNVQE